MEKAKVYFTKEITEESLVKIYEKLGIELKGNVAVKLHSGEEGNQNYLKPLFYKDLIDYVNGTVVECNTAYNGERNTSEKHLKLLEKAAEGDTDAINELGVELAHAQLAALDFRDTITGFKDADGN